MPRAQPTQNCVVCGVNIAARGPTSITCSAICYRFWRRIRYVPKAQPPRQAKCIICGGSFVQRNVCQIVCGSVNCRRSRDRDRRRKPPQHRICIICSAGFVPHPASQVTCSTDCSRARRRTQDTRWAAQRRAASPKKPPRVLQCELCGVEFLATIQGREKYCSAPCRRAHITEAWRLRHTPKIVSRRCVVCGVDFFSVGRQGRFFCSKICRVVSAAERDRASFRLRQMKGRAALRTIRNFGIAGRPIKPIHNGEQRLERAALRAVRELGIEL
jgi:predicted nucleic acid-binding Zn ribbon protein